MLVDEFVDAFFGKREKFVELGAGISGFLSGGLYLDEFAGARHDDVCVDGGVAVFRVVEVEYTAITVHAYGYGSKVIEDGIFLELSIVKQAVYGEASGKPCTGDGGCASTTIGSENVAIYPEGFLGQLP